MRTHAEKLTRIAVDIRNKDSSIEIEHVSAFPVPDEFPHPTYVIAEPGSTSWLIPGDVVNCVIGKEIPRVSSVESFANGYLAWATRTMKPMYLNMTADTLRHRWYKLDAAQVIVDGDHTVTGYWPGPIPVNFDSVLWNDSRKFPGLVHLLSVAERAAAVESRLIPATPRIAKSVTGALPEQSWRDTFRWLRDFRLKVSWSEHLVAGDTWTSLEERVRPQLCRLGSSYPPF